MQARQDGQAVHGCTGKASFTDFREADRRAKFIRQRGGSAVAAYHCRHCHLYHVGGLQGHGRVHAWRDARRRGRLLAEREAEA